MKRIIVTILLFALIISCDKKKKLDESMTVEDAIHINTDSIAIFHFKGKISIDESDIKFGRISIYFKDESGYYLKDYINDDFYKIDNSGKLKYRIGKHGDGPGEFYELASSMTPLSIDSCRNMYIFNDERMVIIKYDSLNQFINERSIRLGIAEYCLAFSGEKRVLSLRSPKQTGCFNNIDFFHILDDSLNSVKMIKMNYPEIYSKYNLFSFTVTSWVTDQNYIYVLFQAYPYIYKYDYEGRLVDILGWIPENYRLADVCFSKDMSTKETMFRMSNITTNSRLFFFKDRYLYYSFSRKPLKKNFTQKDIESEEGSIWGEVLLTTEGEEIEVDRSDVKKLGGLYFSKDGYAYELTGDPDKREINIYEISIEKK